MEKSFLSPPEIAQTFIEVGKKKASTPSLKLFALGLLAGAFIAFAAQGSNSAIHTITSVGLSKALAGAIFATGLMIVLIAGSELFTGNSLIIISVLEGKATLQGMFRNWLFVYLGNFVGSVLIAFLISKSGQLGYTDGLLGGMTIKTAVGKTSLSFGSAFILGIMCNWLVCIAVWMTFAATDIPGKVLTAFFPIWLFVCSGFEHSIANMYYIPAGILAKANQLYVDQAINLGVTPEKLANLNWGTMISKNLLPVTIGNIIGGVCMVGVYYWFVYLKKDSSVATPVAKGGKPAKTINN